MGAYRYRKIRIVIGTYGRYDAFYIEAEVYPTREVIGRRTGWVVRFVGRSATEAQSVARVVCVT